MLHLSLLPCQHVVYRPRRRWGTFFAGVVGRLQLWYVGDVTAHLPETVSWRR
jgi:hypothetical protein